MLNNYLYRLTFLIDKMKKLALLVFGICLVFTSCTDQTEEQNGLIEAAYGIQKQDSTTPNSNGNTPELEEE